MGMVPPEVVAELQYPFREMVCRGWLTPFEEVLWDAGFPGGAGLLRPFPEVR